MGYGGPPRRYLPRFPGPSLPDLRSQVSTHVGEAVGSVFPFGVLFLVGPPPRGTSPLVLAGGCTVYLPTEESTLRAVSTFVRR